MLDSMKFCQSCNVPNISMDIEKVLRIFLPSILGMESKLLDHKDQGLRFESTNHGLQHEQRQSKICT